MQENASILISVIVPVYNVEGYLNECVRSLVSQIHCNIEIVLVDDGSTDGSGKICDKWATADSRIITIHKPNGGEGDARNKGIGVAKGQWLAFVDSDDYIRPNYLADLLYESVTSHSDIVIAGFDEIFDGRAISTVKLQRSTCENNSIYDIAVRYNLTSLGYVAGKLYKSSIIRDNGLAFSKVKLKGDQLFFFSYLRFCKRISFIETHDYCYRQVSNSMSNFSQTFERKLERVMDFHAAVTAIDFMDSRINHLLTRNALDGPIGMLYTGAFSRHERIQRLGQIDKHAYWYEKQIHSLSELVLTVLLVIGTLGVYFPDLG